MISRIVRLLTFLAILVLVLYVVLLNREPITVRLGEGNEYTAMAGVVLITTFLLGLFTASLFGLLFGIRSYLREKKLHNRERQRKALHDGLLLARSYAANKEWNKARAEYEQLMKRHPHDIISRVELSKVVEGQGDAREALRILDTARAEDPENVEVLLRAAELNVALRNKTAAIDNLALVLLHQPSKHAALMARELSEELERFDDALEYQERLDSLGYDSDESAKCRSRIRFKKLVRENPSTIPLKEAIGGFLKRDSSVSALEKLAEIEKASGNKEAAAQNYAKAARESGSVTALKEAANLFIDLNQPQQALATVRAFLKNASGVQRVEGELELIRVYISLSMLDEAQAAFTKLPSIITESKLENTGALAAQVLALQAYTYVKLGDSVKASAALRSLTEGATSVNWDHSEQYNGLAIEAPAPRLSTP